MAATGLTGVLLDLDGTLVDTVDDLAAAANAALADNGLAAVEAGVVAGFVGKGVEMLVRRCLSHLGRDGQDPSAILAAFERHYARLNGTLSMPYPGVVRGLDSMQAQGLQLGVATNKPARFSRPLLAAHGLDQAFSVVACGDTVPRKKPHPDMILHAARTWGMNPEALLMIGDSANDAAAARAAGCRVWLVPYGYREGLELRDIDCDGIVADLSIAARHLELGTQPDPNR